MKKFFILIFSLFCFIKPINAKELSGMKLDNTDDLYQFLQGEKGYIYEYLAISFVRGWLVGMMSLTNIDRLPEQYVKCLDKISAQDIADQFSILYRKGVFKEIKLSGVAILFSVMELCPLK